MVIIFDTNGYRNISQKLFINCNTLEEKKCAAEVFRGKQLSKGINVELDFRVLLELLGHLASEDDPDYPDCENAVILAVGCSYQGNKMAINEGIEMAVLNKFPNENVKQTLRSNQQGFYDLAIEYYKNRRSDKFCQQINMASILLQEYKETLEEGFNLMERDFKSKNISLKQIQSIDEAKIVYYYIALSQIANISNNEELQQCIKQGEYHSFLNQNLTQIDKLIEDHFFGYVHTCEIIKNGYKKDRGNSYLNSYIDMLICYSIGKKDERVLITNDGFSTRDKAKSKIHKTFELHGAVNKIYDFESYLDYIEQP